MRSDEAYKKEQEEYRQQLTKTLLAVNAGRSSEVINAADARLIVDLSLKLWEDVEKLVENRCQLVDMNLRATLIIMMLRMVEMGSKSVIDKIEEVVKKKMTMEDIIAEGVGFVILRDD